MVCSGEIQTIRSACRAIAGFFCIALLVSGQVQPAAANQVIAWGTNDCGQATVPEGLTNVIEVAVGRRHSVALTADGTVVTWGDNTSGQLNIPEGLGRVVGIAAGDYHTLALQEDGRVATWGNTASGQLSVPEGLTNARAVAACYNRSAALLGDGRVVHWGAFFPTEVIASNLVSIELAVEYLLGVTTNEKIELVTEVDWVEDLRRFAPSVSNAIACAAGRMQLAALQSDGRIQSAATMLYPITRSHPSGYIQVCAGDYQFLAVAQDGTVTTWSDPWSNQTNLPAGLTNIAYVAAGNHSLAVTRGTTPILTIHPSSMSIYAGNSCRLHARAAGLGALTFQWEKDSVPLEGKTDQHLDLAVVGPEHAGVYRTRVSSQTGTVLSRAADLTVLHSSPVILEQPTNSTIYRGGTALLSVRTTGSLPQGYLWFSNGVPITMEAQGKLTLTNAQPNAAADYEVVISNSLGSVTSSVARLSVVDVATWGYTTMQTIPGDLTNVVRVAEGIGHTIALLGDGTVRAWGTVSSPATTVPTGLSNVVQIAAGGRHNLALTTDGRVIGWGTNYIANQSYDQGSIPPDVTNVVAVSVYRDQNMALRSDGSIVSWGYGSQPDSKAAAKLKSVVAVSAGEYKSLVLHSDGTITAWNNQGGELKVPENLTNVIALSAGGTYSAALRNDGTVVVWNSASSQLWSDVLTGFSNVVAISSGENFVLGLQSNGKVVAWARGSNTATNVPLDLPPAASVAAGFLRGLAVVCNDAPAIPDYQNHYTLFSGTSTRLFVPVVSSTALKLQWYHEGQPVPFATNSSLVLLSVSGSKAGEYVLRAENASGQAAVARILVHVVESPPLLRDYQASSLAWLKGDRTFSVRLWGSMPQSYQWYQNGTAVEAASNNVLRLTDIKYSDAGVYQLQVSNVHGAILGPEIPLRVDQICAWSKVSSMVTNVPAGLSNIVTLTANQGVCIALHKDGRLTAWGDSDFPSVTPWWHYLPSDGVAAISAGKGHFVALDTTGLVMNMPHPPITAVAVAAGSFHDLALRPDGTVVGWGQNSDGQISIPPGLTNVIRIASGGNHSLALRKNGTVVAWGSNTFGESLVPAGLSNVVAIAAGAYNSLAITCSGEIVGWGGGYCSPIQPPVGVSNVLSAAAADGFGVLLHNDGTVRSWGCAGVATPLPDGLVVADMVIAGGYVGLALIHDTPQEPVTIRNARATASHLEFEVQTKLGHSYILEHTTSITPVQWSVATGVAGDGTVQVMAVSRDESAQGFYRVRQN